MPNTKVSICPQPPWSPWTRSRYANWMLLTRTEISERRVCSGWMRYSKICSRKRKRLCSAEAASAGEASGCCRRVCIGGCSQEGSG